MRHTDGRCTARLRIADQQARIGMEQCLDQPALRRARWKRRQRHPPGDRPVDGAVRGAHLDQREQHRTERLTIVGRAALQHRVRPGGDRALQPAEPLVGRKGQGGALAFEHVAAIELIQQIGEQRQRTGLVGDLLRDDLVERHVGRRVVFEADTSRGRGTLDHLAQLRPRWRQQLEPTIAFRYLYELRCVVSLVPEILSHRGDDPHPTRAHETRNESDEALPFVRRQQLVRKQLFELIEYEYESRGLVLQHAAILPRSDRELAELRCYRIGGLGCGIAQMRRQRRNRLARSDDLRQTFVGRNLHREPAGQRIKEIFALLRIAGTEHDSPQERDAWYASWHEKLRYDPCLHQGRLAGAAGAQYEQERRACRGAGDQLNHGLRQCIVLTEEDRRMLELVGFQSAKRCPRPYPPARFVTGRGHGRNALLDELAQVFLECRGKLSAARELGIGAQIGALVGEVPRPEPVELLELADILPPALGIQGSYARVLAAAVDQQVGCADVPGSLQGFLVLPLRSRYRRAPVDAAVFTHYRALRQRRSQPRPDNQHDDVECARGLNRVLEMPRGNHRLVLPEIGLDREEARVVLRQAFDRECRDLARRNDIARRGKKDPQPPDHDRRPAQLNNMPSWQFDAGGLWQSIRLSPSSRTLWHWIGAATKQKPPPDCSSGGFISKAWQ